MQRIEQHTGLAGRRVLSVLDPLDDHGELQRLLLHVHQVLSHVLVHRVELLKCNIDCHGVLELSMSRK